LLLGRIRSRQSATRLLARKPFKVAAVALANKMARVAWALLAKGGTYRASALVAAA
jgi:transposase